MDTGTSLGRSDVDEDPPKDVKEGEDFAQTDEGDVCGSEEAQTVVGPSNCGGWSQGQLRKDSDDVDKIWEVGRGGGAVSHTVAPANMGEDGIKCLLIENKRA